MRCAPSAFQSSSSAAGRACSELGRLLRSLLPLGAEPAQTRDPVRERRVRAEHAREPVALERVDRVERLGRGRGGERDELAGPIEAEQRIGQVVRVADARRIAVGGELTLRRQQGMRERRSRSERGRTGARGRGTRRSCSSRRASSASRTANIWVSTSRLRTCASSCAMIASSSSRRIARSRPVDTASVALPGPRPTTNARGKPSSMSASFGGRIPSCAETRSVAERRSGSSARANGRASSIPSKARSPSQ